MKNNCRYFIEISSSKWQNDIIVFSTVVLYKILAYIM